jgi:hypothetical protein
LIASSRYDDMEFVLHESGVLVWQKNRPLVFFERGHLMYGKFGGLLHAEAKALWELFNACHKSR